MPLQTDTGTYLTGKEGAKLLGYAYRTFANKRTELGDRFLFGHELLPGRIFFRLEDVERLAAERGL